MKIGNEKWKKKTERGKTGDSQTQKNGRRKLKINNGTKTNNDRIRIDGNQQNR